MTTPSGTRWRNSSTAILWSGSWADTRWPRNTGVCRSRPLRGFALSARFHRRDRRWAGGDGGSESRCGSAGCVTLTRALAIVGEVPRRGRCHRIGRQRTQRPASLAQCGGSAAGAEPRHTDVVLWTRTPNVLLTDREVSNAPARGQASGVGRLRRDRATRSSRDGAEIFQVATGRTRSPLRRRSYSWGANTGRTPSGLAGPGSPGPASPGMGERIALVDDIEDAPRPAHLIRDGKLRGPLRTSRERRSGPDRRPDIGHLLHLGSGMTSGATSSVETGSAGDRCS